MIKIISIGKKEEVDVIIENMVNFKSYERINNDKCVFIYNSYKDALKAIKTLWNRIKDNAGTLDGISNDKSIVFFYTSVTFIDKEYEEI